MSHKRKKDYVAVFEEILKLVTDEDEGYPRVEEIMSDFEKAVWVAVRQVMPLVNMKGCGFHLCQALYKNLKEIGMSSQYRQCEKTRELCRQLLSLNLLPSERIEKRFRAIVAEVEKLEEKKLLQCFCAYVERNWILSTVWPPSTWSMFMQHRRTNNNAEG